MTQAVPFALEEHLASDVEALHFAIGNRTRLRDRHAGRRGRAWSHGSMERNLCSRRVSCPRRPTADSAVVPFVPHGCTLLLDESALYVRRADAVPFVLDAEPLATALDIALGPPPADETDPREHVSFFVSPMEYEANRELIEGLRPRTASLQVKLMTEGALPVLAAQAVDANAVNLLQGTYAPRRSINGGLHAVASARRTCGRSVSLRSWRSRRCRCGNSLRAEKRLDAQITEVFQQALPGQPVVDPRAQMQGVLGGGSAQGALLPALSVLAQAMAGAPTGGKLEAINLHGDRARSAPRCADGRGARRNQAGDGAQRDRCRADLRNTAW